MEEQLIAFNTAKLAKEKGFDWVCYITYSDSNKVPSKFPILESMIGEPTNPKSYQWVNSKIHKNVYTAPTQSLLQRWLRDINGIIVLPLPTATLHWTFKIGTSINFGGPPFKNVNGTDYGLYEEALEEGLLQALNLIKE